MLAPALQDKPQSSLTRTLMLVPAAPVRPLVQRLTVTKRPQLIVDPHRNIKTRGKYKPKKFNNSEIAKQKTNVIKKALQDLKHSEGDSKKIRAKIARLEQERALSRPPEIESTAQETKINLIENQTHAKTYQVMGSLSQDVSNLILNTICPVIDM